MFRIFLQRGQQYAHRAPFSRCEKFPCFLSAMLVEKLDIYVPTYWRTHKSLQIAEVDIIAK